MSNSMTYAAARAILKAPKFGDQDAIAARDLVRNVEESAVILSHCSACQACDGYGEIHAGPTCAWCDGFGAERVDTQGAEALTEIWATLPPDARQEALRRAREQRQVQGGSNVPAGKAVRP